jgi:hypothetical protein
MFKRVYLNSTWCATYIKMTFVGIRYMLTEVIPMKSIEWIQKTKHLTPVLKISYKRKTYILLIGKFLTFDYNYFNTLSQPNSTSTRVRSDKVIRWTTHSSQPTQPTHPKPHHPPTNPTHPIPNKKMSIIVY